MKRQPLPFTSLVIAASLCFVARPLSGAIFSDDFEGYTAGSSLNESGPWADVAAGTLDFSILDETTATPFGTPNQYFDFNDDDSSSVRAFSPNFTEASGTVTTYALDFWEPSSPSGGSLIIGYAEQDADLNSGGSRLAVNLDDGTVTGLTAAGAGTNSYSLDTGYRLYIIFNDTASTVNYTGGSVAAGTADIWLQPLGGGPAVLAGSKGTTNGQTASYRVGFRSFSSNIQRALFDNVALYEGVILPGHAPSIVTKLPADDEPSAPAILDLVATFDKPVVAGSSGSITLKRTDNDNTVETFDVTNPSEVDVSGSTVTVTPTSSLDVSTGYYLLIDAGALEDEGGEPFPGILDKTEWNFTTAVTVTAAFASADHIEGRNESTPIGYYSASSGGGRVGIGGGTGTREDYNFVLSYTLPTLPAGTTVNSALFNFEITEYRNHSGADPALNVYLLDSADPSSTGTAFFYHGPADPNPDVELVGATDLSVPNGDTATYAAGEQAQSYTITGDALALLQSFYGGDNIPDQTTVYFRFNLDNLISPSETGLGADLSGSTFDRYFIKAGSSDSNLIITGASTGGTSEMDVVQGGSVADGGSVAFGTVTLGSNTDLVFTIENNGTADLNLTGTPDLVAVSGTNAGDFTVTADPSTPVSASGSTTFTVQFAPGAAGARGALMTINNNDSDEGTYEITISGTGQTAYDTWATATSVVGGPNDNDDPDTLSNLLEFAFGTNPTVSDAGSLAWDGSTVTPGTPVVQHSFPGGDGVDFTARFIRRVDHGTSGSAAYAWRFSSDLTDWESSADTPTWFAAPGPALDTFTGADGVTYELLEIDYPFFLDNGNKARFFQVEVTEVP